MRVALANPPFGAGIGSDNLPAPARTGIGLAEDKRPRIYDHRDNPIVQGARRNRLCQDLRHAGVTGVDDVLTLGVAGHQDDGRLRPFAVIGGTHNAGEIQAVQGMHQPIGDHHIDDLVLQDLQGIRTVGGKLNIFNSISPKQSRRQLTHKTIVVDDEKAKGRKIVGVFHCHYLPDATPKPARLVQSLPIWR